VASVHIAESVSGGCPTEYNLLYSHSSDVEGNTDTLGDAFTINGVDLVEELALALLNVLLALAEETTDVLNDSITVRVIEDLVPEFAWLLIVSVRVNLIVTTDLLTLEGLTVPGVSGTSRDRCAVHGWLIVSNGTIATHNLHRAITVVVIAHASAVRAVNGDLIVVGA